MSIIETLMARDGLTKHEAEVSLQIAKDAMEPAIEAGDIEECEGILMFELGLEPDYLMEILF